jgi:carboxyl-terminal processing protease
VLVDWGTSYAQKHATLPPISQFSITDADFEELKKMAHESDFKYDRLSEKRLEDLKKMMVFEGYFDDAEDEFNALSKKLEHNMDRDFDRFSTEIRKLMAQEVVKRYYFQAGATEESLKGDIDIEKAYSILANEQEYNKILGKDAQSH